MSNIENAFYSLFMFSFLAGLLYLKPAEPHVTAFCFGVGCAIACVWREWWERRKNRGHQANVPF